MTERPTATSQADPAAPMRERCRARVYYLDVPRYTGRTKSRFEREWRGRQCKCMAVKDGLCSVHYRKATRVTALRLPE